MSPGAEFFDDLIKGYIRSNASLYDLFRGHSWDSDISSTTYPMLASVLATDRIIDWFRPKA